MLTTGKLDSLTQHTAVVGAVWPLNGSHRNGQTTPYLFQKHLLYWEHEYIFSRNKITYVKVTFCANNMLITNVGHYTSLHCLKETAQTCEFYDNIFETDRRKLELRTLCFPP